MNLSHSSCAYIVRATLAVALEAAWGILEATGITHIPSVSRCH